LPRVGEGGNSFPPPCERGVRGGRSRQNHGPVNGAGTARTGRNTRPSKGVGSALFTPLFARGGKVPSQNGEHAQRLRRRVTVSRMPIWISDIRISCNLPTAYFPNHQSLRSSLAVAAGGSSGIRRLWAARMCSRAASRRSSGESPRVPGAFDPAPPAPPLRRRLGDGRLPSPSAVGSGSPFAPPPPCPVSGGSSGESSPSLRRSAFLRRSGRRDFG
jgi:hypothetical protein